MRPSIALLALSTTDEIAGETTRRVVAASADDKMESEESNTCLFAGLVLVVVVDTGIVSQIQIE